MKYATHILAALLGALLSLTIAPLECARAQTTPAAVQVANLGQFRAGAFETFIFIQGMSNPGDGGGGFFAKTFVTTCTDDGFNNLKDKDGQCYVRLTNGAGGFSPITPTAFGAKMDGTTNDCTAATNMAAALTTAGGGIVVIPGMIGLTTGACTPITMPSNVRFDCVPGLGGFKKLGTAVMDHALIWQNPYHLTFNDCTFQGNHKGSGSGDADFLMFHGTGSAPSGDISFRNTTLLDMAESIWVYFDNGGSGLMSKINFDHTRIGQTTYANTATSDAIAFWGETASSVISNISITDTTCDATQMGRCLIFYDGARKALVLRGAFDNAGANITGSNDYTVHIVDNGGGTAPQDITVRDINCSAPRSSCVFAQSASGVHILSNTCNGQLDANAGCFKTVNSQAEISSNNIQTSQIGIVATPSQNKGGDTVVRDNVCNNLTVANAYCIWIFGCSTALGCTTPNAAVRVVHNGGIMDGTSNQVLRVSCTSLTGGSYNCHTIIVRDLWGNVVGGGLLFDDGTVSQKFVAYNLEVSDVLINGNISNGLWILGDDYLASFSNITLDMANSTSGTDYGFRCGGFNMAKINVDGLTLSNWNNGSGQAFNCLGSATNAGNLRNVRFPGYVGGTLVNAASIGWVAPSGACTPGDYAMNLNFNVGGSAGSQYSLQGWACAAPSNAWVQVRTLTGT